LIFSPYQANIEKIKNFSKQTENKFSRMFAANSIRTLMSIKNYNQLDQSKEGGIRAPTAGDKNNNQEIDHSSMQHRDMTDKVISTRVLLKGLRSSLYVF